MIRKPWNKNYICVNSKQTSFNCIQCWSCPELQLCILEVVAVIRVIYPRKGSRGDFWCRKHFMMWRSLYVMEFKYKRQHDFGNAMETLVHKGQGAKWMDCPYNWCDIKSKIQLDVNHYWLEVKADGIMKVRVSSKFNYIKIVLWSLCWGTHFLFFSISLAKCCPTQMGLGLSNLLEGHLWMYLMWSS